MRHLIDNCNVTEAKKSTNTGGDCFKAAFKTFNDLVAKFSGQADQVQLVHAMVDGQGSLSGVRYCHAFVLFNDTVFDHSNGRELSLPKFVYYALGNIVDKPGEYAAYDSEHLAERIAEHGTYGPWDLKDGGRPSTLPWFRGKPIKESMNDADVLTEGPKEDFLLKTYGPKIEEKLSKHPEPGISDAEGLIAHVAESDPTQKKIYTQWMVTRFVKDDLKIEDLAKAQRYLEIFDSNKSQLIKKDINQYKSLSELLDVIRPFATITGRNNLQHRFL